MVSASSSSSSVDSWILALTFGFFRFRFGLDFCGPIGMSDAVVRCAHLPAPQACVLRTQRWADSSHSDDDTLRVSKR